MAAEAVESVRRLTSRAVSAREGPARTRRDLAVHNINRQAQIVFVAAEAVRSARRLTSNAMFTRCTAET